jgi:hypothetical protein
LGSNVPLLIPLRDTMGAYDINQETLSTLSSSFTLAELLPSEIQHLRKDEYTNMGMSCGRIEMMSPIQARRSSLQQTLLSSSPLGHIHGTTLELNTNLSCISTLMLSSPTLSSPFKHMTSSNYMMHYDKEKEEDNHDDGDVLMTSSGSEEMMVSTEQELERDEDSKDHYVSNMATKEKKEWLGLAHSSLQQEDSKTLFSSSSVSYDYPPLKNEKWTSMNTPLVLKTGSSIEQRLCLSDLSMKETSFSPPKITSDRYELESKSRRSR